MNKITIEITSSPIGKKLSGIYLNDELVATEAPYTGTFEIGTFEEYSYFLNFTDQEVGKLLTVKSETSDINKIKLGESLLNIVSLPYSTNTMAKQIKLDVTDTLIQGYRFDEYNNGETLSTSQSYTHTLDSSAENETITVKTTPLWVWPVNFMSGFTDNDASLIPGESYDFTVNTDNREDTPVTINTSQLKKNADVVMTTHNWLVGGEDRLGNLTYIEIGTTNVYDISTSENNYLSLNIVKPILSAADPKLTFYIDGEIVNSPLMGIKGGTVINSDNIAADNTDYDGTLLLPISTVSISPSVSSQQTAEISGKIQQTNIEFPKSIYVALSTSRGYTDPTGSIIVTPSDVSYDSMKDSAVISREVIVGHNQKEQELIAAYLSPKEGDKTSTIQLKVSSQVTGKDDVLFKLTTARLTYFSNPSEDLTTVDITVDPDNNVIKVSTDVFAEMFTSTGNFKLSTWNTYYLIVDGEYTYKNASLTVNAESSDITKIKINDVEEALPFSSNITLGDE